MGVIPREISSTRVIADDLLKGLRLEEAGADSVVEGLVPFGKRESVRRSTKGTRLYLSTSMYVLRHSQITAR